MTSVTPRPTSGRIDTADHHDPTWHIHDVAGDFKLLDAWRLPVAGAVEKFPELIRLFLSLDLGDDEGSRASKFLFAVRYRLGELMGWDDEVLTLPIPGCTETSLRERLPAELQGTWEAVDDSQSEFQIVYETGNEAVVELSNSTVHAVVHFASIVNGERFVAQMGIYVKNRGRLGQLYMPAIAPFRHYIVYPALMRRLESAWQQRVGVQGP